MPRRPEERRSISTSRGTPPTVNKAAPSITVDSKSKQYSDPMPSQGRINTIIRNNGRVYQGNAMTSLSVQPSSCPTAPGGAVFNGKANTKDITDALNPISVDGNATLQVTMTDKGEPGSMGTIAITIWNKSGGLRFSSSWNGTKTLEQSVEAIWQCTESAAWRSSPGWSWRRSPHIGDPLPARKWR